ncbi:MAG: TonB-dependent receptor [Candidatus Angelobacter sp.]|nr:TonB-dependent receptor [Candidatus Angelobacter sp.]
MLKRYIAIITLLALLVSLPAFASVFGTVKAIVHDPQHRPVQGAQVEVQSRTSAFKTSGTTNEEGMALLSNIPVGEYDVKIVSPGFSATQQSVTVTSGNVQEMHFALTLAQHQESVEVSGAPQTVNPSSSTPQALVSRSDIAHTPGADRTNSLSMITDFTPGAYMVHDQLHVRGGHQVTWAIDGVPVPNTNIASNVGPQFDPKDIDFVEEQRGSYSAEYGDRTYGVFNVVTRSGFERSRQGELVTSYGNFNTTDNQLSFGDHNDRSAYYFSVNGNRTDHGLETPTSANIHNQGAGGGVFTSLILNATPNDQLRFVGAGRTDYYQVPIDPNLDPVKDREREQDILGNFSWIHTAGPGIVLTVSPSYHFNRAAFEGGPIDVPISTDNRASSYLGGQTSLAVVKGRHNAKIGYYGFAQHDNTLFALVANDGTGQAISQREKVSGSLQAFFVEDQFKALSWLTINAGVRFTRFSGSLTETAGSPRIGATIQIPHLGWIIRGSYGRFYQAPPLSTVTGPLLQTALDTGLQFVPLRGERDEQHEFGITIPIRGWAFEVDNFRTGAHNFFDHNAIGNSSLFFPLTIEAARIKGTEVTVRAPKVMKRIDVHLAYSHQSAEGSGGITGGFIDPAVLPDAGFFFLDHDQRNTLSTGFSAVLPRKAWVSANFVYGSGFLNGGGPDHLPGYETVDMALGKSFGENWSAKITGTNLANKHYFVDLSNTFGGSHFADPRMVSVQLRYKFHY